MCVRYLQDEVVLKILCKCKSKHMEDEINIIIGIF